jgi:hypothetical protein
MRYPGKIVADLVVAGRYGDPQARHHDDHSGGLARQDTLTGPGTGQGGSRSLLEADRRRAPVVVAHARVDGPGADRDPLSSSRGVPRADLGSGHMRTVACALPTLRVDQMGQRRQRVKGRQRPMV